MTSTRLLGIATAAATVCLSAAGCGAAAHLTGSSDPLADMAAPQIAAKALDNLKSAPSYTLTGSATTAGQKQTMTFGYAGNGCVATIGMGPKGTVTMVMIGNNAWMKADAAFYKSEAGSQGGGSADMFKKFAGKYLKMPSGSGSGAAPGGATCSKSKMTSGASKVPLSTDVTKGSLTTINGQKAYPLTDKAKGVTMYVTDTSSPQFIEMIGGGAGGSGTFTVTYGVPKSVTAPPASETATMPGM